MSHAKKRIFSRPSPSGWSPQVGDPVHLPVDHKKPWGTVIAVLPPDMVRVRFRTIRDATKVEDFFVSDLRPFDFGGKFGGKKG